MKKYSVLAAKGISEDADRTLNDTFEFRHQLTETLKDATRLKAEYDRTNETLLKVQQANIALSQNPSEDEVDFKLRIESLKQQIATYEHELSRETDSLKVIEKNIREQEEDHRGLMERGQQLEDLTHSRLADIQKALGIGCEVKEEGLVITFHGHFGQLLRVDQEKNIIVLNCGDREITEDATDQFAMIKVLYKAWQALNL